MRSFSVLGPMEVIVDSEPITIGGPQQRRLLCALIESAGRTVSVDVLVERLWDDGEQPSGAVPAVRSYVARLRRALDDDGSLVVTSPPGYRLAVASDEVDTLLAEELLQQADSVSTEDPAAAVNHLERAADLWRGEPYGEFAGLSWLTVEIQRVTEVRLNLLERLFAAHLVGGSGPDQIGRLEQAVSEFPLSERLRGQLMMALAYAWRVSDAARAFQAYRTYLAEETGLDPGADLVQLDADIISGKLANQADVGRHGALSSSGSAVGGGLPDPPSKIPVPGTSLIGCGDTVSRIRALLGDHRLVTMTGVGGCGKTRLAIEVASQVAESYADGAYFADLSVVVDPDEVVTAIMEALGLQAGSLDPREHVLAYLADKDALLVLDNCEHLIDACATFADAGLRRVGGWRMLATSREHLDVPGEQTFQVPSLGMDGSSDAVDLFIARSNELRGGPTDNSSHAIVAELCRRLDGMPLAIELAAARTVVMSPAELLDRIEQRFRVLTGRSRGGVQRQRTLETMLDWSYDLLDHDEQHMLCVLGVLRGPFDLATAAAVAERDEFKVLDLLQSLIVKSLLERNEDDDATTYRLLETVRSYAEATLLRANKLTDTRHLALDHILTSLDEIRGSSGNTAGGSFRWPREKVRHWMQLRSLLEAGIDWAIAAERYNDAARILVRGIAMWREALVPQPILDRVEEVREHLPDGELRQQLLGSEITLLLSAGDDARLLAASIQATSSSNEDMRDLGRIIAGQLVVETDPQRAAELAERLPTDSRDRALADMHLMAGQYDAALELLMPHRHDFALSYLTDARIAAILLMKGSAHAALELVESHRDADNIIRPFAVIRGLCHLSQGQRVVAEAEILAEARRRVSGRLRHGVDAALIGMAAIVHDSGDDDWAADIILRLGYVDLMAHQALARWVAGRVGVLDQYHHTRVESFGKNLPAAAPYLGQVLSSWDDKYT